MHLLYRCCFCRVAAVPAAPAAPPLCLFRCCAPRNCSERFAQQLLPRSI